MSGKKEQLELLKHIMEFLNCERIGILLNLTGTIMVAISFGKNPEDASSQDDKGRPVYLASFLYPKMFRLGLLFIITGFIIQFLQTFTF